MTNTRICLACIVQQIVKALAFVEDILSESSLPRLRLQLS